MIYERDLGNMLQDAEEFGPERKLPLPMYLSLLEAMYEIESIYYPGCGHDDDLEEVFNPEKIIYSDRIRRYNLTKGVTFHLASHDANPLSPESVDAIYFVDNHASKHDFSYIEKNLKAGGVIIVGYTCVGEVNAGTIRDLPGYAEVDLPFNSTDHGTKMCVFQKSFDKAPKNSQ